MTVPFRNRIKLIGGAVALLLSLAGFVALWPELRMGLASLMWAQRPGTVVAAYYHLEYDPVASHGMDYSFHNDWVGLEVAFTTAEGEHRVAKHVDVAGLVPGPDFFWTPLSAQMRHVLNRGEHPRVYYNPRDPSEAALRPGIPYAAGIVLLLPVALLAIGVALWRSTEPWAKDAKRIPAGPMIAAWGVGLMLAGFANLGLSHFWVRVTSALVPWWLLPVVALGLLGVALFPRLAMKIHAGAVIGWVCVVLLLLGFTGWFFSERDSFGFEPTETEYVQRLDHAHPAVVGAAVLHFTRVAAPPAAAAPLERFAAGGSNDEIRERAAAALQRMAAAERR